MLNSRSASQTNSSRNKSINGKSSIQNNIDNESSIKGSELM